MAQMGSPGLPAVILRDLQESRWVSLDIGPFPDQQRLLAFAAMLEAAPGVGQVDLIDADLRTALFAVRFRSAEEFSTLIAHLPGYRIAPTTLANMVSARIKTRNPLAAIMWLPEIVADGVRSVFRQVRDGLQQSGASNAATTGSIAAGTIAAVATAGLLFLAVAGPPQTTPAAVTPPPNTRIPGPPARPAVPPPPSQ